MQLLLAFLLAGNIELHDLEAPTVGCWYHVFWSLKPGELQHWNGVKAWHRPYPLKGRYDCEDPKVIERQVKAMKDCGIQFLVFDDTNCVHVDNGQIDRRIQTWFDWMDKQPENERLALAIAPGGELNVHNNRESWTEAINFLYDKYAHRPSYANLDGKPLLLWYIDKDVWADWGDRRWTVKKAFVFQRVEDQLKNGGWGGGSKFPRGNKECMSLMPSWHRPDGGPQDFVKRDNGNHYRQSWMEVLRHRPRYVLIASWNEWAEDTAIEDSTEWRNQYTRLTKGYVAAARHKRLDGFVYTIEGTADSYKSSHGKPVKTRLRDTGSNIVVPKDYFPQ